MSDKYPRSGDVWQFLTTAEFPIDVLIIVLDQRDSGFLQRNVRHETWNVMFVSGHIDGSQVDAGYRTALSWPGRSLNLISRVHHDE